MNRDADPFVAEYKQRTRAAALIHQGCSAVLNDLRVGFEFKEKLRLATLEQTAAQRTLQGVRGIECARTEVSFETDSVSRSY
jgi:hypothetical protein